MSSKKVYFLAIILGVLFINVKGKAVQKVVKMEQDKVEKVLPKIAECAAANGLDVSILSQIIARKYSDDDKTKSFFLCGLTKTGCVDSNGEVFIDKMLSYYPADVKTEGVRKVLEECNKQSGEPKDKVFKFYKCYEENSPVLITFEFKKS